MSKTTSMVLLLRVSSVLLMVVYHDIRTELIHKIFTLSFMRSAPRTLLMKLVLTWPRGLGALASCGYCKLVFQRWESCQPVSTIERGLSIVQSPRHNGHTHPARCSHDSTVHHVAIQPIATTAHAMSVNTRAMFSR